MGQIANIKATKLTPMDAQLPKTVEAADIRGVDPNALGFDLHPGVEHSRQFHNGLPFDIKVVFRTGIALIIPANAISFKETGGKLVVRNSYVYRGGVKLDINQLSGMLQGYGSKEREEVVKSIDNEFRINDNGYRRIRVDYAITADKLNHESNGIYVPELDVVITRFIQTPSYHPYSDEGKILEEMTKLPHDKYGYSVEIVDPYKECGDRFVNISGTISRVQANARTDIEPGVYVASGSRGDIVSMRYEFTEAFEKKIIYRTGDEAIHFGDILKEKERAFKERELQHEQEIERLKHDHSITKAQYEKSMLEAKEKYERRSMENKDRYETRGMIQRDHYESRSYERKDSSETLKWLPAIITGAAVVAGVAIKTFFAVPTSGLSFLWPF